MNFMISRETENVHSSKDVEDAFRALTEGSDKEYVTEQELYQVIIIAIYGLCCYTTYMRHSNKLIRFHQFQFSFLCHLLNIDF